MCSLHWHTHALRLAVLLVAALLLLTGLVGIAYAQQRQVLLIEVNGIINPVVEGFIARAVEEAEAENAELLIVQLDTPGGLLDSTRKITQHLLGAKAPTAVFVAPRGAQAASAGTFIAAAATFAVMAPGTNIGAATPVGGGGEDLPETLKSKATNDAAAEMRSIASLRGRNIEKLEATVLQAASYSADEAVEMGVVDFIASDLDDLLAILDGKEAIVQPPDGVRVILKTQGASVRVLNQTLVEGFLNFVSDPNVSFLLLSLGSLGIFVELLNPGLIVPGVVGAILLILAFISFGALPINWGGVVLILLAVALGVAEAYVAGFGFLGIAAVLSFALGGFLLFFHTGGPSPTMPAIRVSLWVLAPTLALMAGGGGWVLHTIVQSRRGPNGVLQPHVIGMVGRAVTDLTPDGIVHVDGEDWSATLVGCEVIQAGRHVRVTDVSGSTITVEPVVLEAGDTESATKE